MQRVDKQRSKDARVTQCSVDAFAAFRPKHTLQLLAHELLALGRRQRCENEEVRHCCVQEEQTLARRSSVAQFVELVDVIGSSDVEQSSEREEGGKGDDVVEHETMHCCRHERTVHNRTEFVPFGIHDAVHHVAGLSVIVSTQVA